MAVNNFFDEQNRNLQLQHALMGMQGQYNQLVADRMQMGNFAMQEQRMQLANTLAMNEHLHMQGNNPAFHNRMPMPNNGPPMGPGTGSNPGAGFAPGPMPPAEGDWDRQQGRDRDNRRDRNGERRDRNYSSTRDDRGHDRGRRRESRGGSNNSSKSRYPRDDDRLSDEDIVSTNYPGTHDDEEGHSDRLSGHDGNGRDSDRSYARDRGYSRGRDRDYSRDRNRDRSRDRDRDYDRRDRDRDRDRDYSRERSKDASDYDDTSFQREKFVSSSPTNTILLKGLPSGFTELNVREEVKSRCQFEIKDVRVMKRHNAGMSRGFAFVELLSVDNARRWMDLYQGEFYLEDQTRITMYYGTARGVTTAAASARTFAPSAAHQKLNMMTKLDWICKKCSAHNFKRRDYCFKCSLSREESENLSSPTGEDQVGSNPCNTLLFRGLDALTTEETLSAAVQRESGIVPKNVLLMRDTVTGVSKCYGFSEMTSIKESDQFLSIVIAHPPFEVDGKGILVNYAKNTFSTIIATLDREYSDQQSSNRQASTTSAYQEQAQIPGYYYDHATNQYRDNATGLPYTPSKSDEPPSQNNAAAVAQAAIQRAHKQKHQLDSTDTNADTTRTTPTVSPENVPDGSGTYSYPVPDVSTYEYDATSTYYYDATTGLYYDANTQYYYNSHISKYLYWDGERQTYLLEPSQTGASNAAGTTEEDGESGNTEKKGKKKEKEVKVAKQIAKDMAKWAKSQNAKQEALADMKRAQHGNVKESASADAGFAMLERKTPAEERKLMPPPPMAAPAPCAAVDTGLVASYGGDSDDEEDPSGMEALDESKLVDWDKLACLLCKRQFPQKETLQKHLTKSGLHKKNLDELRKSTESEAQQRSIQYRDRAKERRAKYGAPAPPVSKRMSKRPEPQLIPEQPTKAGIGQDNIGNQLLQKMGWSEGSGLGRQGQGRVNPVEAKRRSATAGLGAQGANYDYDPSDTYKESAKKAMFARYKELE